MIRIISFLLFLFFSFYSIAQSFTITNDIISIDLKQKNRLFTYTNLISNKKFSLELPDVELNNKKVKTEVNNWKVLAEPKVLLNASTEYAFEATTQLSGLRMQLYFRIVPDNPIIKFRWVLVSDKPYKLTKSTGADYIHYFSVLIDSVSAITEIRMSDFNEKSHATHLKEAGFSDGQLKYGTSVMGPILSVQSANHQLVFAYEHGSMYPDRFLEFQWSPSGKILLKADKANYLSNQSITPAAPFETLWFEMGVIKGTQDEMAAAYRSFILKGISENNASRQPYIYYNTWGRQEKIKWAGGTYLQTMRLQYTLDEIETAYKMGVEVYVLDVGWFLRTGDWEVNKEFFPDGLQKVAETLKAKGMKLGLWFNPKAAAVQSRMLERNKQFQMSYDGKFGDPIPIWDTEESVDVCLVSDYWTDFAKELTRLIKETGVSYFKWDAIGQYGCNAVGHSHGDSTHSNVERNDRYAYLLPVFMGKIISKVHEESPNAIFDFDITEDGRAVGLLFLAHGKYFLMNNGPYYHNFNAAGMWKGPTPESSANIFINPGSARGWFTRTTLDYDRWIPSILFLVHYFPYGSNTYQLQSIGSLMLGHNGIWGDLSDMDSSGIRLFNQHLNLFKKISKDVTESRMEQTGLPGDSYEVYEKINPANGKGIIVIFANQSGHYEYYSKHKIHKDFIAGEGCTVVRTKDGYAKITVEADKESTFISYFGTH